MNILIRLLLTVLVIPPPPLHSKPNMVFWGSKVLKRHRTERYDCVRTYVFAPTLITGIVTGNVSKNSILFFFFLAEQMKPRHSNHRITVIQFIWRKLFVVSK